MKISENFDLRELVSRDIWRQYGENSIWFVSQFQIDCAELTKKVFSTDEEKAIVVINDYLWGGSVINGGTRHPLTDVGATLSQHKFMNAIDPKIKIGGRYLSSDEIFYTFRENYHLFKKIGVTTIENPKKTTGWRDWLHMDGRITNQNELLIVDP